MVSNYSQTIRAAVFAEQAGGAWVGPDVAKKNHNAWVDVANHHTITMS